jgi:phytoene dehydrogenase-like protein
MREMTGSDKAWADYERFLELEKALAAHVWPSMLEPLRSKEDFESKMTTELSKEAWRSFVEEPLGRAIERYAEHDALRGLLMTDGKIGVFSHPHDPSLLQNRCFLYHVVGGGDGEWRVPVGGMRALVDSLVDVCRRSSVDFLTSAEVRAVGVVGQGPHEVAFSNDGQIVQVEAEHVLVNAGPRTFAKILGQPYEAKEENEGSVIKMNMLLKRLPKVRAEGVSAEEAFAGSFHIDEGYEQMQASYDAALKREIPIPAPGEIYCHTLTDPSILSPELQKEGYQTLTLFGLDMPYRLFDVDHDARRDAILNLYLEGLDRVCAEPIRDCLAVSKDGELCVEIKTPQDLEREVDLDQGNIFHDAPSWFYASSAEDEGTWGVETEFPRVYRAGSSAIRGGAVSGIPGRNAAMCVLGC